MTSKIDKLMTDTASLMRNAGVEPDVMKRESKIVGGDAEYRSAKTQKAGAPEREVLGQAAVNNAAEAALALPRAVVDSTNVVIGGLKGTKAAWDIAAAGLEYMSRSAAMKIDYSGTKKEMIDAGKLPESAKLLKEKQAVLDAIVSRVKKEHLPNLKASLDRIATGAKMTARDLASLPKDVAEAFVQIEGAGLLSIKDAAVATAAAVAGACVATYQWAKPKVVAGYNKAVDITSQGIEATVNAAKAAKNATVAAAKASYNEAVKVTSEGIEKTAKAIDKGAKAVQKFGNNLADSAAILNREAMIVANESLANVSTSMSKFFSAISGNLASDAKAANARAQQLRLQPAN